MNKTYTGIGSRSTPPNILTIMNDLAYYFASKGYTLRSGKAGGADEAFQLGVEDYLINQGQRLSETQIDDLAEVLLNKPNVPVRHHCIYQDDFQDNPTQLISTVELIFENGKCYISQGILLDEFLDIMEYWDDEDV